MGWLKILNQENESRKTLKSYKGSVLIIDDEIDLTNTLSNFLEKNGYRAFQANSGEEGIQAFLKHQTDIVVTDLKMPGINGIDVIRQIREQNEQVEIIVLTAYEESELIIRALKNRASDFILKPVDLETLKLTIEKAFERIKLRQRVSDYTYKLEKLLQEARYTKEYLQKVVENSPQAIITYDLEGKISEWNSEAERITGYTAKEVLGKPLRDIFVLEDVLIKRDSLPDEWKQKNIIAQIMTKNGELKYISRNANALVDEENHLIGVIENFYDITDQIKNDQLLGKRYLQLQTINEIGKKIASCNDLDEISQFVSDRLVKTFFESSQVTIFYFDPAVKKLVLKAMAGYNIDKIRKHFPIGKQIAPDKGIIGHVFKNGEEVIARDISQIPYFNPGPLKETRSEFAFPIRFKDQVFGVLNIENIERIDLDEADRFMLEAIAEYLGIGKERIELMDRIKRQNIQLEKQAKELKAALTKVEKQKKIIEDQHKRLITDLQKAGEFQRSLLPEVLPDVKELRFATLYLPSSQLGGDFYDIFELSDRYLVIVLADASGHGVAAAMLSAMFKITLYKYLDEIINPARVLEKMNSDFCRVLQMGEFFSTFLAVFDKQENIFRYANAGHPRPLLYAYQSKDIIELDTNGFLLGIIDEGTEYEQKELLMDQPYRLMIYTDGINEAVNEDEEQFGVDRIKFLISEYASLEPDEFVNRLQKRLVDFTGSTNFEDDVTIIVADKLGENVNGKGG